MSYNKELSKFLSYVLRHKPEAIGLVLDENGWADLDQLVTLGNVHMPFTLADIILVVDLNEKQRFTLSYVNNKIRANQGHSIDVDVQLKEAIPPSRLYHGTTEKFLSAIGKEGLKPMGRQHVHLSADVETARTIASRRGRPVVLSIRTPALVAFNQKFYLSENGVWLTSHVSSNCLQLEP